MSREDEFFELKKEYESIQPPEELLERMRASMGDARSAVRKRKVVSMVRNTAIGAAAAAAVVVLPNSDSNVATAMGKIPLIGGLIRVVTVRNYDIQDENTDIDVDVPELEVAEGDKEEKPVKEDPKKPETVEEDKTEAPEQEDKAEEIEDAAEQITSEADKYINRLLGEYKNSSEGKTAIVSRSWVVTDDDNWFTLGIFSSVAKADGTEMERYYHIDKNTGKVATIADAFVDGADYISVINKQIEHKMAQEPDKYFSKEDAKEFGTGFTSISADQNFHFDSKGNLVVVFDEGSIAPASEGIVRFTISEDSLKDILKYSVLRDRQGSSTANDNTTEQPADNSNTDNTTTTPSEGTTGRQDDNNTKPEEPKEEKPADEEVDVTVVTDEEEEIEVVSGDFDDEEEAEAEQKVEEVEVEEVVEIVPRRPEGVSRPVTGAAIDAEEEAETEVVE